MKMFQSARPRGARLDLIAQLGRHAVVSIRAPARGATCCQWPAIRGMGRFNPRAREGRDPATSCASTARLRFQSARPRGARRCRRSRCQGCRRVSIRAPARGATGPPGARERGHSRFNPRAREGRDRPRWRRQRRSQPGFNPRAREGRDLSLLSFATSIWPSFNPRAREGRDMQCVPDFIPPRMFQSARPRGARQKAPARCATPKRVSIRAPARGATSGEIRATLDVLVSIRAPARGATPPGYSERQNAEVSIRAPARGATPGMGGGRPPADGFNPRAREGRDSLKKAEGACRVRFNPRAREGRDRGALIRRCRGHRFNPRAREGRDSRTRSGCPAQTCFNPRAREGRDPRAWTHLATSRGFNPRAREGRDAKSVDPLSNL